MSIQSSDEQIARRGAGADARDAQEAARLQALNRYAILDTPAEAAFDRITGLAARLFDTPIALITLVDRDRIWFKSAHGLDPAEISRDPGLCDSAIMQDGPYVLEDASSDPRASANPLVTGPFGLRFYCAAPLRTSDGHHLGTLCVIDQRPRKPTPDQVAHLVDLAAITMHQIDLNREARKMADAKDAEISERDVALGIANLTAREIDHRVKNDLQIIGAMLHLQARAAGDADAAKALGSAAERISAVARVHQHVRVGPETRDVATLDYVRRLCADLSQALGVEIIVKGEECEIGAGKIGKLGMIVNELATNAAKHGAPPVHVWFGGDAQTGGCLLTVADHGFGLPEDFEPDKSPGLGMRVVCALVRELGGNLTHGPSPAGEGTIFRVSFVP